jgi:hypothetical protein
LRKPAGKTVMIPQPAAGMSLFGDLEPDAIVRDRNTLDALFSATYEELRRLAATVRSSDAHATINPTAPGDLASTLQTHRSSGDAAGPG